MKFPRNSKLLRSPFDAAPFAAVFFLLVIFLALGALMPTPGLPLELPVAENLPGTDKPTVSVGVDMATNKDGGYYGRYYFENQIVTREALGKSLQTAISNSPEPLTLLIHADKGVTYEELVKITLLARQSGITNVLLATLPAESGSGGARP